MGHYMIKMIHNISMDGIFLNILLEDVSKFNETKMWIMKDLN